MAACNIGFVMEQAMGHITYHRNLARWAESDPSIRPTWFPIPYHREDRWSRTPLVRRNVSMRLSLRARDDLEAARADTCCDVLFYHTQCTAMLSSGFAQRVPTVISMDATPINMDSQGRGYQHRPDPGGPISLIKKSCYRRVFGSATALTTWSHWAKDSLVRDYLVDPEKIEVIRPGVDLEYWQAARPRHDRRAVPRLLFVGGDFTRKGGEVFLEALRAGLSERCEVDVVTNTEGIESSANVRIHRNLDASTPTFKRLFEDADIFLLPTLADCSPMAIIEAMAAGLPVVATDVGAVAELVIDGETGLLVPPGDPTALGRAITELIADPDRRDAYAESGRLRARCHFDGRRNYSILAKLLKRCALGQPSPV